jgi:hypothetical protein
VVFKLRGDGPTAARLRTATGKFGEFRAAQAATGDQQRDRLEQVGLARAVRAGEEVDPPLGRETQRLVGAEIREGQAGELREFQTRIGMRT